MNFNFGEPSYLSSSPSDDESSLTDSMEMDDEEEEAVVHAIQSNNIVIAHLIRQQNKKQHRGSVSGHVIINRDRERANWNLFTEYFAENPRYNEVMFRRRFRMSRSLFLRIIETVKQHENYFQQRQDGLGRLGLSTLQKITTVFRMLTYGIPVDATDERYLRSPTALDVARLLHIGKRYGFPGMLGSLDCMHWVWKNCPTAWAGQYAGRSGTPSIILEAVADYDLWIWHAYFGLPGSNNDINVLESSYLFSNLAQGTAPEARYVIQGKEYNMGYYLADSIYPKWSTIVQTIHEPRGPKKIYFTMKQEACRKDVERAFGVLQSRFAIIAGPTRFWQKSVLHDIMTACIIMHNMIVEDERDLDAPIEDANEAPPSEVEMVIDKNTRFQQFMARHRQIKDKNAHIALRNALIEHLWETYTDSDD